MLINMTPMHVVQMTIMQIIDMAVMPNRRVPTLLEAWQQASRHWLDRMQSEMALWADLGSKLAKTRSVREALEAYGKCVSQQMKMTAEDAQHLLNDWQQVTQKMMRLSSNGRPIGTW